MSNFKMCEDDIAKIFKSIFRNRVSFLNEYLGLKLRNIFFMFHKLSWWLLVVIHSPSCVWLWDPMDCGTPGSSVLHGFPELAQTHVHWVSDGFSLSTSSSANPFSFCLHPRRKWQLTPVFLPGEIHEQYWWIPATSLPNVPGSGLSSLFLATTWNAVPLF